MNEKNAELQAITDTIKLYIEGLHNGDIGTLKKAFHPKAMMYGISAKAVTIVEIEGCMVLFPLIIHRQKPGSLINVSYLLYNMTGMPPLLKWLKNLLMAAIIPIISSY